MLTARQAPNAPTYHNALIANQARIIQEEWANKESSPLKFTPSAENKSRKWLLWIGVPVAFFVGGYLPFLAAEISNPTNSVDRIKEGCRREFGYLGQEHVNNCAIRLMIRKGRELNQQALERANR